jgi:hypothetical protein
VTVGWLLRAAGGTADTAAAADGRTFHQKFSAKFRFVSDLFTVFSNSFDDDRAALWGRSRWWV